ncbi:PX domain-containing protein/PXA domain-containing protein/Nexin_C domain-containing protein [Cephalotus follicularis]|uniref:PX domain-containing protein/PXA domain-containing protein/Nexin_C domain-containing protein n=1 Tax=Cephalotus follicularis TaxID=3775 RepID=A0A1Q3CWT2_CEPFO|nr:PX domain-containing protein/PXA domain-containing protein/Nexin_C domain-containing protein [Cephalotus follicularis]
MKAMETIQDLIEEAKLRTVWWGICIFSVAYFLSHTSTSMWMNLPIAVLLLSGLRILANEVDIRWKVRSVRPQTYLSHLERKQLSVNDSRLSSAPPLPKWKRKIDSPVLEAAVNEFIDKILKDFVIDLWYSDITPDREAPELIRAVILDAIGEISGRVKEINLVDLLTRDIVDLVGDHLDLFRRNQAAIGADVMGTLSSEERDERLKHHLVASKELHPALMSPESEYKILQRLVGGVLAVVLRPREAQSRLVRSIARELVTCLVMQPLMSFASPGYINELIECIFLAIKDNSTKEEGCNQSGRGVNSQGSVMTLAKVQDQTETSLAYDTYQDEHMHPQPADWARMLEAATQRRTEVLMPENLENMWTKGRNYQKKERRSVKAGTDRYTNRAGITTGVEDKTILHLTSRLSLDSYGNVNGTQSSSFEGQHLFTVTECSSDLAADGNTNRLKRSNSTSDLKAKSDNKKAYTGDVGGPIISEFYSPDFVRPSDNYRAKNAPVIVLRSDGPQVPKLRCRVMGAYFEKLASKSFAVYSIAVTDAENRTWFVKRRYRNFERLHRYLKDIPNYTLHLPPKRIFSSSTEDAFVHQRCIQLDKYLQDLLSIANVAEQHEVWDFLSASSKNYSFGKSSSVMRTLAVNVDDAVDDIVRQFRGVSDGLIRKVVSSSSPTDEASSSISGRNLSWNADEINKLVLRQTASDTTNSLSDNEEGGKDENHGHEDISSDAEAKGWHSDNEVNSKVFPSRVVKHGEKFSSLSLEKKHNIEVKSDWSGHGGLPTVNSVTSSHLKEMPPEWTPPNVSVPLLNLVDKVFQLKRRGWLRRQVFWISKQILQLVMEDAIDDWLLRQIYLLRREDIIAQGIQWVQDVLWPGGTFFTRVGMNQTDQGSFQIMSQIGSSKVSQGVSFELQLEACRRASDVKKLLFDGAPAALVSLIGNKQYKRCAKDIYYFTQSTICVKQLAYAILELLLVSVFPELQDLVLDLHDKKGFKHA